MEKARTLVLGRNRLVGDILGAFAADILGGNNPTCSFLVDIYSTAISFSCLFK
jgi:hypothetical protein